MLYYDDPIEVASTLGQPRQIKQAQKDAKEFLHLVARGEQLIELLVHPADQAASPEPSKRRAAFVAAGHPTPHLHANLGYGSSRRQSSRRSGDAKCRSQLNPVGSGAEGIAATGRR